MQELLDRFSKQIAHRNAEDFLADLTTHFNMWFSIYLSRLHAMECHAEDCEIHGDEFGTMIDDE